MSEYGKTAEDDMEPFDKEHWIHSAQADAKVAQAARAALPKDKVMTDHEPDMEPEDKLFLGKSAR